MNNVGATIVTGAIFGVITVAFFIRGRSDKYAIMNKMIRFSHDSIHELENKKTKFGGST